MTSYVTRDPEGKSFSFSISADPLFSHEQEEVKHDGKKGRKDKLALSSPRLIWLFNKTNTCLYCHFSRLGGDNRREFRALNMQNVAYGGRRGIPITVSSFPCLLSLICLCFWEMGSGWQEEVKKSFQRRRGVFKKSPSWDSLVYTSPLSPVLLLLRIVWPQGGVWGTSRSWTSAISQNKLVPKSTVPLPQSVTRARGTGWGWGREGEG